MGSITPEGIFAALGGAALVGKLLGPTAEYLGENLKELVKKRQENTARIFRNAGKKLGDKIEEEGSVPSRVLKEVLGEGSFAEDDVVGEYFGGVLASSRTPEGRDDRGVTISKLVSRLSSYQLRAHYVFYEAIRQCNRSKDINLHAGGELFKAQTYIPYATFLVAMEFRKEEASQFFSLLAHIISGLYKERLIHTYRYGESDHLLVPDVQPGIVVQPSVLGTELFLWAHGKGHVEINDLFDVQIEDDIRLDINFDISSCKATSKTIVVN